MDLSIKIIAVLFPFVWLPVYLQAQQELHLNQKRLSERALVVWTGDYMQTIATVTLSTQKGIVVIETSLTRSEDERIRKTIEKEFGRDDFIYLINTHYHHDHTAGNQVYSDATVIGHKNTPAGMRKELTGEGLVNLIEKFKAMSVSWEEGLRNTEERSRDYHFGREYSRKQH